MSKAKNEFNKGFNPKVRGKKTELNDLSINELRNQIYNIVNPVDSETDERNYNYFIREIFIVPNYIILEDWNDSDNLYKINYQISNETVTLDPEDKWVKVEETYQPVGQELNQMITELNAQIAEYKEELKSMSDKNKDNEKDLQVKVDELNTKINELNETIVSQESDKKEKEAKIGELNKQIEELNSYKEKWEAAQKDAKLKELSGKYSKLLSKQAFESEETKKALNDLDEVALNSIVVAEIAKEKASMDVDTKDKKDVEIAARSQEDLLPQDRREKLYAVRG